MKFALKALSIAVLGAASTFTFAEAPASEHSVSGNIGVLSSYNLRGITNVPENKDATIQGGLDYSHASGFYAGWWGSTLNYGDDLPNGFENDFYAGYNGSINDDLGYTAGLTYYYYYDIDTSDANGLETMLGLSYKDFGLTAEKLAKVGKLSLAELEALWNETTVPSHRQSIVSFYKDKFISGDPDFVNRAKVDLMNRLTNGGFTREQDEISGRYKISATEM